GSVGIVLHGVISLAVAAAGWVGSVHPEITPPSNFHHLRDTTRSTAGGGLGDFVAPEQGY
ncbi:hypothetical protein, partial [Pseudophaeobacter sp.]|uniref:hypothetical protein n=1 Tax=Pseudophaeobacter sp. TaxID=1971739 RepID=UPI0032D8E654